MKQSILATDGYKFSMAEAGWPLRQETFYYSHRRGGPHYLPFDPEEMVLSLLPKEGTREEYDFLAKNGYSMGGGFQEAIKSKVVVKGLPKGSWFFDREPVFSVTGSSAIASWLEPLVLRLHYRIQIATLAKLNPERLAEEVGIVTCEEQKQIVLETLESVGVKAPDIKVDSKGYFRYVKARVTRLTLAAPGSLSRIFEVGMRAATCEEQHQIALEACRHVGVMGTSNISLAKLLDMVGLGTMGHEHVQRYGSDEAAFRAMRDRFPGPSSFLLDTFSTIKSGLPTAFKLIQEDPSRKDSVRFDSGDKVTQYLIACSMAKAMGITPRFILEDGFTLEMVEEFERLREFTGVAAEDQLYGFGGYIVKDEWTSLTRDRVAAIWKVTQTAGKATMKFGDEPGAGKESIPGKPVLWRPFLGSASYKGPTGIVFQEGEELPEKGSGVLLSGLDEFPMSLQCSIADALNWARRQNRPHYSPHTQSLVSSLHAKRDSTHQEI